MGGSSMGGAGAGFRPWNMGGASYGSASSNNLAALLGQAGIGRGGMSDLQMSRQRPANMGPPADPEAAWNQHLMTAKYAPGTDMAAAKEAFLARTAGAGGDGGMPAPPSRLPASLPMVQNGMGGISPYGPMGGGMSFFGGGWGGSPPMAPWSPFRGGWGGLPMPSQRLFGIGGGGWPFGGGGFFY